jgi:O-methyltransferase
MNPDAYQFHKVPNTAANHFKGRLLVSDQVSAQDVGLVWRELAKTLAADVPGDIVEFGCYVGTTSLFIRRLLDEQKQSGNREFHVYDSFAGLPDKLPQDTSAAGVDFQAGKLSVSKKEFLSQFHAANLKPPIIHKGWFDDLTPTDVPEKIAFAFLDGDFYGSILTSLQLVWPRLAPGALLLIDDYRRESLPGVEQAIHDYFNGSAMLAIHAEHNIAVIRR